MGQIGWRAGWEDLVGCLCSAIALAHVRGDHRQERRPRMHGINLDGLSEAELIELHDAVVDRLHFLHQQKTAHALLGLAIGERVVFEDNYGQTQAGSVIRRNRKTVTVHGDNGRQWNVSPQLLRKEKRTDEGQSGKLVPFSRKA
nr:hypothetical protein [Sinorhizobium meliloti]